MHDFKSHLAWLFFNGLLSFFYNKVTQKDKKVPCRKNYYLFFGLRHPIGKRDKGFWSYLSFVRSSRPYWDKMLFNQIVKVCGFDGSFVIVDTDPHSHFEVDPVFVFVVFILLHPYCRMDSFAKVVHDNTREALLLYKILTSGVQVCQSHCIFQFSECRFDLPAQSINLFDLADWKQIPRQRRDDRFICIFGNDYMLA